MSKGVARGGHKSPAKTAKKAGKAGKAGKVAEDSNTGVNDPVESVAEILLGLDTSRGSDQIQQDQIQQDQIQIQQDQIQQDQIQQDQIHCLQFTDQLLRKVIMEILEGDINYRTITQENVQLLIQRWNSEGTELEGTKWNDTNTLVNMFGNVQWMLARVEACSEVIGVNSFVLRMQAWFAYNPQLATSFIPDVRRRFLVSNISHHAVANVRSVGYLSATYMKAKPEYLEALRNFMYTGSDGSVKKTNVCPPPPSTYPVILYRVNQQVALGQKANSIALRSVVRHHIRQLLKLGSNTIIHHKVASNIEGTLYSTADSFNAHVDSGTLKQRLLLVIEQYMTRVNEIADNYIAHCNGDRSNDHDLSSKEPIDDDRRVLLNGRQDIVRSTHSWLVRLINNSTINHKALDQVEIYLYYTVYLYEGHVNLRDLQNDHLRVIKKYRTYSSENTNVWRNILSES